MTTFTVESGGIFDDNSTRLTWSTRVSNDTLRKGGYDLAQALRVDFERSLFEMIRRMD